MRERILKNITWLFFERVFRTLGTFVIGVIVARYLGPEKFGLLGYALALVFFFSFLSHLGLHQVAVREFKKKPDRLPELMGTTFALKLAGALLAVLLVAAFTAFFRPLAPELGPLVLVIAAGFVFQALDVIDYFFQAQILSRPVVLARNSAFVISGMLKLGFVWLGLDVFWFALAGTLDLVFCALFMLLAYFRQGHLAKRWRFDPGVAKELLGYSWPLMFSALLVTVHMRVDQVMIGGLLSAMEVGWYVVAVRLAEFWYFFPLLLVQTLMPYFVSLRERDPGLYRARLVQLYSLMFWGGVMVAILVLLFGEALITMVFGEAYRPATQALLLNIWAGVFVAQGVARGIWMIAEDLQKYRLYSNLVAVVLNIGGNAVLIPRMGIAGAALATLVTQAVSLWGISLVWRPLRTSTLDLMRAVNPARLILGPGR